MSTAGFTWRPLARLSVRLRHGVTTDRRQEPLTFGLPLPKGTLCDASWLELLSPSSQPVRLQARVLERWSDGSIRWVLLDFRADVDGKSEAHYHVGMRERHGDAEARIVAPAMEGAAPFTFDAGMATLIVSDGSPLSMSLEGEKASRGPTTLTGTVEIADDDGPWRVEALRASVVEAGDLRNRLRLSGTARCRTSRRELVVVLAIDIYPGLPIIRCDLTIGNPHRAAHPGGIWELGDGGSVLLRDVAFVLRFPFGSSPVMTHCSAEPGRPLSCRGSRLDLYQDSSGRPNWHSANHVNRDGEVRTRFKGYELVGEAASERGDCATPVVTAQRGDIQVALAVPEFWQNFPKAIEASEAGVCLRLFPHQFADRHEIQGGEQKTQRFGISLAADRISDIPLDWTRSPLFVSADPELYCRTEALPFLVSAAGDPEGDPYRGLVTEVLEGQRAFVRERDVIDEYGWRHYGDIYANHETVGHAGPDPLISHYNNQYDAVAGFAAQFMMTGDHRWWDLMDPLARHVVDIDIYRTTEDKAGFNGGLFWHTYHYLDAGRCSHRSYPKAPGVAGGGPSNEHDYTTGLLVHYLLTGDEASRDAVVLLANWVVDMDDGDLTVFRWLARGRTGLASSTVEPSFHGPGRGAANSIATLLNAQRLTGEGRYAEKAEELIRRCIHPDDNVEARGLLDPERRWSYTVFLQQLGRYLMHKAERNEFDRMYAYARCSLLHYARWMARFERPYLEKPDILEYPTETWAAQDIRKSDVFYLASACAEGAERELFLERGGFFWDYSLATLSQTETRSFARPLVIMLSNGLAHAWFARHPGVTFPGVATEGGFDAPQAFTPQKAKALSRAKTVLLAGAAAIILLTCLVLLYWRS